MCLNFYSARESIALTVSHLIPGDWCALTLHKGKPYLTDARGQMHDVGMLRQNIGMFACPPILLCYRQFMLPRCGIDIATSLTICDLDEIALLANTSVGEVLQSYTQPAALFDAAAQCVQKVAALMTQPHRLALLLQLKQAGSPWAEVILKAANIHIAPDEEAIHRHNAFTFVGQLPERLDPLPRLTTDADDAPVADSEVLSTLAQAIGNTGEQRHGQRDYAVLVNKAMQPNENPHVVLAEAGTGTGKTAGYLAAAVARARTSERPVMIATYTKALQRQAEREAARFFSNPALRKQQVVVRKGRENYLCLLKYADAVMMPEVLSAPMRAALALLGWCVADGTHDGDLSDIAPRIQALYPLPQSVYSFSDKRGECLHSSCPYFKKCFIERVQSAARRAQIVIANHALVLHGSENNDRLGIVGARVIFDEAHRLFDAADSAYATVMGVNDLYDLRRRLRGNDGRALHTRLEGALNDCEPPHRDAIINAADTLSLLADALPNDGCLQRLRSQVPVGVVEEFFHALYAASQQLHQKNEPYFDVPLPPVTPLLLQHTQAALGIFEGLAEAGAALVHAIEAACDEKPALIERLNSFMRLNEDTLRRRLPTYQAMLGRLLPDTPSPTHVVDFVEVVPLEARLFDITLRRHLLNPAQEFADRVLRRAAGTVMTSATLCDDAHNETISQGAWIAAEQRTGANAAIVPALRASYPSSFDYATNAQVFVVTGGRALNNNDIACANAFVQLSRAVGGGTLGIFTAISRVKQVYTHAHRLLEQEGISLYAQHIHGADVSLCADLFRDDRDSCLIGTDAVRDGLDVPGDSLRLVVCDKIPYPRPTYLHTQRREAFGGFAYDRMLIRMRLKQAFGRLLRRGSDRGAFVMLDDRGDKGLWSWLPEGVRIQYLPLEQIVQRLPQVVEKQ